MKVAILSAALSLCYATSLGKREDYTVYGEGQNVAINAPGLAFSPAFKGFPSGGVGPSQTLQKDAISEANGTPGLVPEGVNPASCTVKEGQYPLILIPGTGDTVYTAWAYYGPRLVQEEGLCVYSFNHNPLKDFWTGKEVNDNSFAGDITQSAAALGVFIDEVLAITGAEKVDLMGHSQGAGALPYWYLKYVMQGIKVRKHVAIAPSLGTDIDGLNNLYEVVLPGVIGTVVDELLDVFFNCGSYMQQLIDSAFMLILHDNGGPAVPGVEYVNIANSHDNVLIPYTNCFVEQQDRNITNVLIQDYCSQDESDHGGVLWDPNVYQIARNYLLDRDDPVVCEAYPPS